MINFKIIHNHKNGLCEKISNACSWNEWICSGAANRGHLKVLKWAQENGCARKSM